MHIDVAFGKETLGLEIDPENLISPNRTPMPAAIEDPMEAMRQALEKPYNFPALRRALTPDDQIAIVVDESLPQLPHLLEALLQYLLDANIKMDAVTMVCLPPSTLQTWLDDLPEQFDDAKIEVHNPDERKKLRYLATTKNGRRIYINRTVVDADQSIVLSRLGYNSISGYCGAELAIFPALSDDSTRKSMQGQLSLKPLGRNSFQIRQEAAEVTWLLGAPFFVQVIEDKDAELAHIVCGVQESVDVGHKLLDQRWRVEIEDPADVVVASLSGDPSRHSFAEMSKALANAARVVRRNGRIVLLTDSNPEMGPAASFLKDVEDGAEALRVIAREPIQERESAFQWASAADQATIYLYSQIPEDSAEDLLTIPLKKPQETQKLLSKDRTCLFLPDAHKMMAVLRNGNGSP